MGTKIDPAKADVDCRWNGYEEILNDPTSGFLSVFDSIDPGEKYQNQEKEIMKLHKRIYLDYRCARPSESSRAVGIGTTACRPAGLSRIAHDHRDSKGDLA